MRDLSSLGISPTPWYVEEYSYYTNGPAVEGALVFDENGGQRDIFSDNLTSIENARLIAAAPELYEALAAVVSWYERNRPLPYEENGIQMIMDYAKKAIEKASGEEVK